MSWQPESKNFTVASTPRSCLAIHQCQPSLARRGEVFRRLAGTWQSGTSKLQEVLLMPVIEVDRLVKNYDGKTVVDDVSFSV